MRRRRRAGPATGLCWQVGCRAVHGQYGRLSVGLEWGVGCWDFRGLSGECGERGVDSGCGERGVDSGCGDSGEWTVGVGTPGSE
jgi:hypothetical protein